MPKFKLSEVFKVDFTIEAVDKAAARKVYSKLFDKNIKLGHSDWKGLDKEIQGGKFYVYTESENGVPTLEKFTEF